jgi:hypothetical protein
MTLWLARAVGLATLCSFALEGCGGSAAPEAKEANDAPSRAERHAAKSAPVEDEAEPEPESPKSSCDDGGCFACGNGTCPAGWYCDEGASGGAACSWLPGCGAKTSCGCVAKTFGSACSCSDEGGGPHLSCK